MSKNGRRIRAADERRRSSFRGMIACFVCAWQQENRRSIMIYDGAFALLLAAFGIADLRSWKRNDRLLRKMKARKDG